jgi:hypothetical protein
MKKFWLISYLIEALLTVIGLLVGGLSFVVGLIAWAITGTEANCVSQFCESVLIVLLHYVAPVFMFLFVINGFHSFEQIAKSNKN